MDALANDLLWGAGAIAKELLGPVVGRIYKLSVAPTGNWWFWAVQLFSAVAADSGTAETREAAMAEFKAQWQRRRR